MNKKIKLCAQVVIILACAFGVAPVAAADQRVQLNNGASLAATEVAQATGGWITFKMSDGTRAVAALETGTTVDAPVIDGWDDALLLLHAGGGVEFRGVIDAQGGALVFKRRDGLALTLPARQVAQVTGVHTVRQKAAVATSAASASAEKNVFAVAAITNEDLPKVANPSPEAPTEIVGDAAESVATANDEDGKSNSKSKSENEDEDWWRSEMDRLNSKIEDVRKRMYSVFAERRALEAEITERGGLVTDEQKTQRQRLNRQQRRFEKERDAAEAEKSQLEKRRGA